MPGDDGTIKLGYDGKKVEAGFSSLESRAKSSAKSVEGTFASLSTRISGHFKNVATGVAQGIGQGLWSTAVAGAKQLGKEVAGVDVTQLIDSAVNANAILDSLLDRATKLGTSAESLQRLELFGAVNGRSPEEMADAMAKLAKNMANIGDDEGARKAVDALNLDLENFARLEPDRQLIVLAKAFQDAEKKGIGLAEIYELLGKSGGNLLQILRQPIADLEELSNAKVIPEEVVQRASDISDELTKAADAKNKILLQSRTELQLNKEQLEKLKEQTAERGKHQQAVRDASAAQLAADAKAGNQKDADKDAKKDREEALRKATSVQDLIDQTQVAKLRASGRNRSADKLERDINLRNTAQKISEETGLPLDQATQVATDFQGLNDRITRRENIRNGIRNRTRGYSGEQRAKNKFLDQRTFNEFFHPEDVANGQRPRDSFRQGFKDFFYTDPMTGARGVRLAPGGGAAIGRQQTPQSKAPSDVLTILTQQLQALNKLASY